MTDRSSRPIRVSREGDLLRLAFSYDEQLRARVRTMHWAEYHPDSRTWTVPVSAQAVEVLWSLFYDGLIDNSPADLLRDGEEPPVASDAVVRAGTTSRPYYVHTARYDEKLNSQLRAVPTAYFSKEARAWTYGPQAAVALADLVASGAVEDPDELVSGKVGMTIAFDVRTGRFRVLCSDERAQAAFDHYFPKIDVVAEWRKADMDISFADPFSEEVYRGALAGEGYQPEGFLIDLYPYQRQGVAFGMARTGVLIADEPGLGKSAQGIGIGFESLKTGQYSRVLIVCPAHLRTQWSQEITKFCGDTDIVVVDGDPKKRRAAYEQGAEARWVIVHYDVLSRDADFAEAKKLAKNSVLIVDEAHRIRNAKAKRSKAVRALGKLAAKRVALSATAVENSPDEWYWVLSFAVPGCLGSSFPEFGDRYMFRKQWGGYEGARRLDELHERSKYHFLRRRKADVADFLPPLRVQHMALDPEPEYAQLLRRVHKEAKEELAASEKMQATARAVAAKTDLDAEAVLESTAGMTAVGMLRMLCSSPRLLRSSDSEAAAQLIEAGLVPNIDGPKLDELRVLAAEYRAVGERLVVFTSFKRMADLISERLTEDQIPFVTLTGETSRADRDDAVARFTDPEEDVTVFLATDAAAEGLNLGKTCWTLINVDIPWTAGRLEQRANRIHRLDGTHRRYLVINMTTRGTIEEGILRRVEKKADLSDAILGDTDGRARTTGRSGRHLDIVADALKEVA